MLSGSVVRFLSGPVLSGPEEFSFCMKKSSSHANEGPSMHVVLGKLAPTYLVDGLMADGSWYVKTEDARRRTQDARRKTQDKKPQVPSKAEREWGRALDACMQCIHTRTHACSQQRNQKGFLLPCNLPWRAGATRRRMHDDDAICAQFPEHEWLGGPHERMN